MKIYLVGGAVRDEILKRTIVEYDWVVVGETQQSMLVAGYQQVGKDFPVFLHPETKEEYALARKERKTAKGYHGFEFDTNTSVTLEEDLLRRDLTINAIAKDDTGQLTDPYHGIADLQAKILRHVSPAFAEDPVRILRVARFAARFSDFSVATETNVLMRDMVENGEVDALVSERVWKEFEKAMSETAPWRFIEVLSDCGALKILFPVFHLNYKEVVSSLKQFCLVTSDGFERIVLIMQSTDSPKEIENLCKHYRAPKPLLEMVTLVMKYQEDFQHSMQASPSDLLNLLKLLDAFRRPDRFKHWLKLCEFVTREFFSKQYLLNAFSQIEKIDIPQEFLEKNDGEAIGEYINRQRLEKLEKLFP